MPFIIRLQIEIADLQLQFTLQAPDLVLIDHSTLLTTLFPAMLCLVDSFTGTILHESCKTAKTSADLFHTLISCCAFALQVLVIMLNETGKPDITTS